MQVLECKVTHGSVTIYITILRSTEDYLKTPAEGWNTNWGIFIRKDHEHDDENPFSGMAGISNVSALVENGKVVEIKATVRAGGSEDLSKILKRSEGSSEIDSYWEEYDGSLEKIGDARCQHL